MVIHAKVFILKGQFWNILQKGKVYLNNTRRIRLFVMDNSFVEFVVFDPLRLHEPKISRNAHLKDINCSHYNIIELRKKISSSDRFFIEENLIQKNSSFFKSEQSELIITWIAKKIGDFVRREVRFWNAKVNSWVFLSNCFELL